MRGGQCGSLWATGTKKSKAKENVLQEQEELGSAGQETAFQVTNIWCCHHISPPLRNVWSTMSSVTFDM